MAFFNISALSSLSLPSSADLISPALAGASRLTIIEHDRSTASAMVPGALRREPVNTQGSQATRDRSCLRG